MAGRVLVRLNCVAGEIVTRSFEPTAGRHLLSFIVLSPNGSVGAWNKTRTVDRKILGPKDSSR